MLRKLAVFLLIVSGLGMAVRPCAADGGPGLTRMTGNDGKPFELGVSRHGGGPSLQALGGPYFLGGDRFTEDPPVWFIDGAVCRPVIGYKRGGTRLSLEVVATGGGWYLTYVSAGANKFWRLDGADAKPVCLPDGSRFSHRARITRGGERAFLYNTDYDGHTSLFELKGATAEPVTFTDHANHGGASYAWWVNGKLLVAFYQAGTYDFYWLKDGVFEPCWKRNGVQDYDEQVDHILSMPAGDRLYFEIFRNDKSAHLWTLVDDKLAAVSDGSIRTLRDWQDASCVAGNSHGLYFVAENKAKQLQVYLAEGAKVTPLKAGNEPLLAEFLHCRGGSVLAGDALVQGTKVTKLPQPDAEKPAHYELVTADVLQQDGKLVRFADGKLTKLELDGRPEDFGTVNQSWTLTSNGKPQTCLVERVGGDRLEYRLWLLGG